MREVRNTLPSSGFSRPAIMLMIVVLPVPFLARMPRELPSSTRKEARSRMTLRDLPVQKDLLTFSNAIMLGLLARLLHCALGLARHLTLGRKC